MQYIGAMVSLDAHEDREIIRTSLLERVQAGPLAIISLVAPAGFGKTTLVRQLLASIPAFAICDCRGIDSDLELARRLLPALADETPHRAASLSQNEGMLGNGPGTHDGISIASAAWRSATHPSAFVFENAEDAINHPSVRDLFTRLLAERPNARTVVICSREPLRLHLSRFAPPHRVLALRASDLAFTSDELQELFARLNVAPATVQRIAAVSLGWPIAVLLLARFAHEGRLEHLLEKLDDVAFETLHEYLADQVLDTLDPTLLDALLACSAIPRATLHDITLAHEVPALAQQFAEFQKTSPFIAHSAAGVYTVHPLLATLLLHRHPERVANLLDRVVRRYEMVGEWLRAAELHLARGDQEAAANALSEYEVIEEEAPPIGYSRILASLDHEIVLRRPRLWAVRSLLRTFSTDVQLMLWEAESIWGSLPPKTPTIVRFYIFGFRVLYMSYLGRFEQALTLIEEFRAATATPQVPQTKMHGWLLFLRSLMTARMGCLGEAQRDLDTAWPLVNGMHVMGSSTLLTMGADIARVRGERDNERILLEHAIETARKSGLSNFVAFNVAEAAFGAWLAGDDTELIQHALTLEEGVEREGLHGLAFFSSCARRRSRRPTAVDLPRYVACGHLLLCGDAEDRATAHEHAQAAAEAARRYHAPFLEVLAALALAETGPAGTRSAALADAQRLASTIDSEPLRDAVRGIATGGDPGFLSRFLGRLRREHVGGGESHIFVELLTGTVRRGTRTIVLPERELALLTACAIRPEAVTRERLTGHLWPDLEDTAARNAFHVCMHRLKQHIGDGIVVRTKNGYRLEPDVRVDLWEIERTMTALRAEGPPDDARACALHDILERLKTERPAHCADWEWFEPTERRLRELRLDAASLLAKRALAENRPQEALALSDELITYDPCDEPAREIAISAHLAMGDRAAALRHFRRYRETLKAELDCEPSSGLARLVGVKN